MELALDGRDLDLEEFKALREEILQKVETISTFQRLAAGAAAALYAWLVTHEADVGRWIWILPFVFAVVGWVWAAKIGHQAYIAGQYILILEKRLRPHPFIEQWVYESLPEQVKSEIVSNQPLPEVYGWESYIRVPGVRKRFLDRTSHFFWFLYAVISLVIAIWALVRQPPA